MGWDGMIAFYSLFLQDLGANKNHELTQVEPVMERTRSPKHLEKLLETNVDRDEWGL